MQSTLKCSTQTHTSGLPPHSPCDCVIDLLPGTMPPCCKIYPLSPLEQCAMEEYIEVALQQECIQPSMSLASANFFFALWALLCSEHLPESDQWCPLWPSGEVCHSLHRRHHDLFIQPWTAYHPCKRGSVSTLDEPVIPQNQKVWVPCEGCLYVD